MNTLKQLLQTSIATSLLFNSMSFAETINQSVRGSASIPADQNGGFLDLGLGIAYYQSPIWGYPEDNIDPSFGYTTELYLNVNGRYQYQGFFIEAYSQGINDFNLGYNLVSQTNWSIDIVGAPEHLGMGDQDNNKTWKNAQLTPREADFNLGIRANYALPNLMIEVRALQDITGIHGGHTFSAYFGNSWQHRNLNLHLLAGLNYHSRQANEYYFNVSPEESSLLVPAYSDASSDTTANIELGLTYPLKEDWVWRGMYRYSKIMSGITNSPLIIRDESHILVSSVSYVF